MGPSDNYRVGEPVRLTCRGCGFKFESMPYRRLGAVQVFRRCRHCRKPMPRGTARKPRADNWGQKYADPAYPLPEFRHGSYER